MSLGPVVLVEPVSRITDSNSELATAAGIDVYEGTHNLGTLFVVVAAYRVDQVWKPFPWSWFTPDKNTVVLEVPAGTDLNTHEILIVS